MGNRGIVGPGIAKLSAVLTGRQFRILSPALALDETNGRRTSITLPEGAIVAVIDGPKPDVPLVRVVWGKYWLLMYAQDLMKRGEQIISSDRV